MPGRSRTGRVSSRTGRPSRAPTAPPSCASSSRGDWGVGPRSYSARVTCQIEVREPSGVRDAELVARALGEPSRVDAHNVGGFRLRLNLERRPWFGVADQLTVALERD